MKKSIFLFLISISFSQIILADLNHTYEAMFTLINKGSTWNVIITFEQVSTRWDADYNFTTGYTYGEQELVNPKAASGFDFITDPNAGTNPIMAIGLYKITAYENDVEMAHFYMDWRTSDYEVITTPDVYFLYDVANNNFRDYEDTQVINNSTQTVWDLRSDISHITTGLETSIPQSPSVVSYNSMPKITWLRLFQDDYVTGYDVYRSFTSPNLGFSKIATTTNQEYVDNEVHVGSGSNVYYKVKAVNGNRVSAFSNVVYINYDGLNRNSDKDFEKPEKSFENALLQNYPNPFNPNTTIEYSINKPDYVSLKIYSIAGEELASLINDHQVAGNYKVEFDASKLPSGVYIYQLRTSEFNVSRKLTLVK